MKPVYLIGGLLLGLLASCNTMSQDPLPEVDAEALRISAYIQQIQSQDLNQAVLVQHGPGFTLDWIAPGEGRAKASGPYAGVAALRTAALAKSTSADWAALLAGLETPAGWVVDPAATEVALTELARTDPDQAARFAQTLLPLYETVAAMGDPSDPATMTKRAGWNQDPNGDRLAQAALDQFVVFQQQQGKAAAAALPTLRSLAGA